MRQGRNIADMVYHIQCIYTDSVDSLSGNRIPINAPYFLGGYSRNENVYCIYSDREQYGNWLCFLSLGETRHMWHIFGCVAVMAFYSTKIFNRKPAYLTLYIIHQIRKREEKKAKHNKRNRTKHKRENIKKGFASLER